MGAKRLGGKRPGGKRLGGETTREEMVWGQNDPDSLSVTVSFISTSVGLICSFDENFKEEVEDELRDIMEGKIEGDQESSEKCEKFLNHDIPWMR